MNILVACKIVPDDQDIKAAPDGSLDFSKARMVISSYDKNAIEAAGMIADGGSVKAIAVGSSKADDSKVKKDILARGIDELFLTADDAAESYDAFATAAELAKLAEAAGAYDAIIVGDGSADLYAKQTGVQLAATLGVPYVSAVVEAAAEGDKIAAKRLLESEVESVSVPTPCVIAVTPDFAEARICGMKDILKAGKKPMSVGGAQAGAAAATEEVAVKAPEAVARKQQVFTDIDEFAAAVKAAL